MLKTIISKQVELPTVFLCMLIQEVVEPRRAQVIRCQVLESLFYLTQIFVGRFISNFNDMVENMEESAFQKEHFFYLPNTEQIFFFFGMVGILTVGVSFVLDHGPILDDFIAWRDISHLNLNSTKIKDALSPNGFCPYITKKWHILWGAAFNEHSNAHLWFWETKQKGGGGAGQEMLAVGLLRSQGAPLDFQDTKPHETHWTFKWLKFTV